VRILHVAPSYKPAYIYGGPILSVAALCENQIKAGHSVQVFCTLANGSTELDIPAGKNRFVEGVSVSYFRRLTKDHSHFSPSLLWTLLRKAKNFDVLHFHSWWNLVTIPGILFCQLVSKKAFLSPRGMFGDFTFQSPAKHLFHQLLGRYLLKNVVFHATSSREKLEILKRMPGAQVFVLPNIVGIPTFPEGKKQKPKDIFQLLFLSRIHPKKGLDQLFPALAMLPFNWSLTIAGSGDDPYITQLKSLAAKLGIAQQLHWLGWLSGDDKYRALQSVDAMVLTSHHENFANVVVESLAMGTPVLVSDKVGLCDYVEANKLGRVCSLNPEDIAEKLSDLQADTEGRAHIRNTAPDLIRRDFDPQILARKYVETYKYYFFNNE
jgi:glycosyltransferase involved in cell wall biosynthesis